MIVLTVKLNVLTFRQLFLPSFVFTITNEDEKCPNSPSSLSNPPQNTLLQKFFYMDWAIQGTDGEMFGQLLGPALPHIKWIFPHSQERSITVNGGARMPGWYDIISLERIVGQEDEVGMLESKSLIQELIDAELDLGIPNTRIIVGGFSQGAAMSLLTGLGSKIKLNGLAVLSGYLPNL